MSRGCVPIVFRKGGLPEIIENGRNGFIVDDVNEVKLKECIANVIKTNDLEQLMGQAIKDSKKYDINITINELYSVYKKLIGDKK
ncbi:D-inositol-3-phosphate glycosyltransferase [compost metagenome]